MLSLGVNIAHDRGAALVKDGEIVCAISQERLDRKKHSSDVVLPYQAMEYCLKAGNVKYSDLDIAIINWPHHDRAYPVKDKVKKELKELCGSAIFVPHHLAHAYSTFFASPFDDAVVLITDGAGNRFCDETKDFHKEWKWKITADPISIEAESGYYFASNEAKDCIYKRWQTRTGDNQKISLGRMYWTACQHVGMGILDGGKLMGLAPYGEKHVPNPENMIQRNGEDFDVDLNVILRMPNNTFDDKAKVAWVTQYNLEETLVWIANMLYNKCKSKNICIAGGVGLNSVSNERILRESPFENIFIIPASDDSGIALGCAYFGYYEVLKGRERKPYKTYTGRAYSNDEIISALQGLNYYKSNDVYKETAQLIADKKIIGWYQGGSEYGPRALGNRSILCDPRDGEMKDILNDKVKHREAYRPFAPAVLYDKADEFFDIKSECPYMLQIVNVLKEKKHVLEAITHVDGTARVQTVTKQQNERLYDLINAYYELVGIPVILNTSFNVAGEPIVETPENAVNCFLNTQIDVLVLGDYIVKKADQSNLGV